MVMIFWLFMLLLLMMFQIFTVLNEEAQYIKMLGFIKNH